ncbi:uncharacterized protein LOC119316458 [Triticum dicoccoides]|uniref:uncharacterized protein LOC119316458 n=1 Tax=Triticum dicoccoides TaxID=85692 RepID=UPI001891ECC8|nr:uncharacterized protein LOC119316458 [Triticum dicoccoides]
MCGRGEKEDWDAGIISRHRRASATAATLASTDDAMEQVKAWFPDDTVSSCKHVQFCPWILHPLCASSLDTTLPLLQPQLAPMTPCMQQVKMRGERAQNGIRHHLGTPLFCCCDPTTDDAMEQVKGSTLTDVERFMDLTVALLPMYGEAKLLLVLYLWHPSILGAGHVYDGFLCPVVVTTSSDACWS